MDQFENNVIVALIPQSNDWCKIEPCHMTVVHVGTIDKLKPTQFNALAKSVSSIATITNSIIAKIIGKDVLGEDERVDVFLIDPTPEILSVRELLDSWDTGDFPIYLPHITIGPQGTSVDINPMYVFFNRIMILWGTERLTFWLRKP